MRKPWHQIQGFSLPDVSSVSSFNQVGCPWSQFELGRLLTCEERLCAWVRQPMNTYSNLALFLAAIALYSQGTRTQNGTLRDFGVLATLLGISSSLGHASQIRALVFLDYASQFILFAYLISFNWERLRGTTGSRWKRTLGLATLFAIPNLIDKRAGVVVFVLLTGLYLLSEYKGSLKRPARSYAKLRSGLAIFAVAAICFGLDTSGVLCLPTRHLFQL
ncbi:MAG: hypothetical protein ACJ763_09520, partial [Bdellovibrionia bacterium]